MLSSARNLSAARICALLVASSGALFAQSNAAGGIGGTVKGPDGAPISSALVRLDSGRGTFEARTDQKGQFLFSQQIPGGARLKVHAEGMTDVSMQVTVVVNQVAQLNIALKPIAGATIEVVAYAPPQAGADTSTALIGATFTQETLHSLPIIGDPLNALIVTMPGTPSGGYNFNGSQDNQNSFMYDGIEARTASSGQSVLQVNRDLIEQIQVLTTGVSAKFGRFTGAMVDTVSKSGTNEFTGSMTHELLSDSWNALPRQSLFTDSQRVPRHVTDLQSWTVLGPIIKDKLFFTVGYQTQTPSTFHVVTTSLRSGLFPSFQYDSEAQQSTKDLKLDWQINTDHRLSAAWQQYQSTSTEGTSGSGQSSLATTSGPSKTDIGFYSLGYLGILNSNLQLDVKLSQTHKQSGGPGTGSPGGADVITWIDKSVIGSGDKYDNGTVRSPLAKEKITTFGVNFTWLVADHKVEAGLQDYSSIYQTMGNTAPDAGYIGLTPSGAEIYFNGWTSAAPPSMDRQYRAMATANSLRTRLIEFDPLQGQRDLRVTGLYANDVWRIDPHWNLTYGARLDRYKFTSSPEGDTFSPTAFTPRASLSYDLKGDGKHVFGLSVAEYAGLTNTGDFTNATVTGNVPVRMYKYYGAGTGADALNSNGTVNWNVWGNAPGVTGMNNPYFQSANPITNRQTTVASDIKPPRTREATLNYHYTDQAQNFIATLLYKVQDHYVDDRWDGAPGLAPGTAPIVLWNDPGAEARTISLQLQYRRQFTPALSAGGNVSWTGVRANAGQGNNSYRNDFGGLIPNDYVSPYGPQPGQWSSSTTPFMGHLDVTYRLDLGKYGTVTTSLLGHYWSKSFAGYRGIYGYTPDAIANQGYSPDLNRTFTNDPEWWPEMYQFDFHLGYDLKLTKKVALFAALDVKNVFNHMMPMYKFFSSVLMDGQGNVYTDPSTYPADWWSNPSYKAAPDKTGPYGDGNVGAYTDPRTIQVKLGFRF